MSEDQSPKKQQRSPNHPAFDLAEAIARIGRVYEKDKKSPTTPEVIVLHLGYSATNGPGGRALSGLRQFGLLEEAGGGQLRVSDTAYEILHYPDDSQERRAALKRASVSPTLYRELCEQYSEGLPSDDTLRAILLKRGFNPAVLDNVIRDFRATVSLVTSLDPAPAARVRSEEPTKAETQPTREPAELIRSVGDAKSYAFAFSGEARAELKIVGAYTLDDLDDLKGHLEITLRGLIRAKSQEHKP